MSAKAANPTVTTIGIDLGKTTFHLIGLDARGAIVLRQKYSRGQLQARLANLAPAGLVWRRVWAPIISADSFWRWAMT